MKKYVVLVAVLAVGMLAATADAASLGMRFVDIGGGAIVHNDGEVTMAPTDTVGVEVLITMLATSFTSPMGYSMNLDLAGLTPANYTVTAESAAYPGWSSVSGAPVAALDNYFVGAGDPNNLVGLPFTGVPTTYVVSSFVIHKEGPADFTDYSLTMLKGGASPAMVGAAAPFTHEWGFRVAGPAFFHFADITEPRAYGYGHPGGGFAAPDITPIPMIIHNVPEPTSLALLAIGGLALLRRR